MAGYRASIDSQREKTSKQISDSTAVRNRFNCAVIQANLDLDGLTGLPPPPSPPNDDANPPIPQPLTMSDSPQWCSDSCLTCSNLVPSGATYCSRACQPSIDAETSYFDAQFSWSQHNTAKISAWAFEVDCSSSRPSPKTIRSTASHPVLLSGLKQQQRPTAHVTLRTNDNDLPSPSSPISTRSRNTALESLSIVASSLPYSTSSAAKRYLSLGRRGSCPPVTASPEKPHRTRLPLLLPQKSTESTYTRPTTPSTGSPTLVAEVNGADKFHWAHAKAAGRV
ncbi:hypothetical protein MIND_00135500 [Mycena indigotica]|uniref:Uncharacterized protein n=1 Tax=Mycena indigotica TaxID=2126181 RepID=A0A8H6WII6_9AGAR|nr:uncharacterized protein MIND_00135500 [Mycena indigotica]KAF7316173.1 hypothetical protein MIND_00135500 [Mycena indigotica]